MGVIELGVQLSIHSIPSCVDCGMEQNMETPVFFLNVQYAIDEITCCITHNDVLLSIRNPDLPTVIIQPLEDVLLLMAHSIGHTLHRSVLTTQTSTVR